MIIMFSIDPPSVSIPNKSPYTINMGDLAILYCTSLGNPIPRVQWFKDDTAVNPISSPFQQIFIVPTNMPHTTVYTCKGINYIANKKHAMSANITITIKGKYECNYVIKFLHKICSYKTLPSTTGCPDKWHENID